MGPLIVVPDACVLIPASLRDTIFRMSITGMYDIRLTDDIIEEVRRNLVEKLTISEDKAQRLADTIKVKFKRRFVVPGRHLIEAMPINEKDRHVLAAAVCSEASIIITQNLKDFPIETLANYQVVAQSPDDFLISMLHFDEETTINVLAEQVSILRNPPMTVLELLDHLRLHAPIFADLVMGEITRRDRRIKYQGR